MPQLKLEKFSNWFFLLLLFLGFVLQLYLVYFGYIHYHYLVPPGSDAIQHYRIIQTILDTGQINFISYPPGFHVLTILASKVSGVDTFSILTYWTPILVLLPSLSMFFLLKQLFDNRVSTLATLIFLLGSAYPLYGFIDGNYPNILAYGVLGILMFGFIIRFLKTKRYINLIISSLLLLAIALIHHFTFINILLILLVFFLIQGVSLIAGKKIQAKIWCWQFFAGLIAFMIMAVTLYFSIKFYGDTILKFANGFISNTPALKNEYLNEPLNFNEYATLAGELVWFLGLGGLFYLLISSFKAGPEAKAKQLVLIWIAYFFIMSRLDATALPARFARELAPALVVAIAFLLNYLLNLNPQKIRGYRVFLGYGLVGFMIITNSLLYTGIAKVPNSFNDMIWFWPNDQEKIDKIHDILDNDLDDQSSRRVLYNPYANLYIPIKADNGFMPLKLTPEEIKLAEENLDTAYDYIPLSSKKIKELTGYPKMIHDLREEHNKIQFIFIDVKPPSNPSEKVYPRYSGYDVYKKVMTDMVDSGTAIEKFSDGSRLYQMF